MQWSEGAPEDVFAALSLAAAQSAAAGAATTSPPAPPQEASLALPPGVTFNPAAFPARTATSAAPVLIQGRPTRLAVTHFGDTLLVIATQVPTLGTMLLIRYGLFTFAFVPMRCADRARAR